VKAAARRRSRATGYQSPPHVVVESLRDRNVDRRPTDPMHEDSWRSPRFRIEHVRENGFALSEYTPFFRGIEHAWVRLDGPGGWMAEVVSRDAMDGADGAVTTRWYLDGALVGVDHVEDLLDPATVAATAVAKLTSALCARAS
jgi:hypothetical protein